MKITESQLRALQTLFSLYVRREGVRAMDDGRSERLAWASQQLGHEVPSFTELRSNEAAQLIDTLKQSLGQGVNPPVRRRLGREAAMARGTHGRRGRKAKVEMMATLEVLEEIERLRARLGWTPENFEGWLRSRSSPLRGRAEPKLRTVGDCNRCRWALNAMLRRGEHHTETPQAEAKVS